MRQIEHALKPVEGEFAVSQERGRIYVEALGDYDYEETVQALSRVFGIVAICPMWQVEEQGFEQLASDVLSYMKEVYPDSRKSFKVSSRRANKAFPMDSQEINAELGGRILEACPRDACGCASSGHYAVRGDPQQGQYLFHVDPRGRGACRWERQAGQCSCFSGGIDSPGGRIHDCQAGRDH